MASINSYSSELDSLCDKILKEYGEFGFIITNPQTGKIVVTYNDDMIFYNKYCPGSLLKPFAIIGLSKTSIMDKSETIFCRGDSNPEMQCWLAKGHGKLEFDRSHRAFMQLLFLLFFKRQAG